MRFVPIWREFIIEAKAKSDRIFDPFVALLQARIRLSGTLSVTLPPYLARREPAARRRSVAMGRERKRTRDNHKGSSDRIGPAVGSGADRHCGRNASGTAHCGACGGPAAAASSRT